MAGCVTVFTGGKAWEDIQADMATTGRIRIGISGWRYAGWRGVFYPKGLAQRSELEFAASKFGTVEINGTFYSLQRPQSFTDWAAMTPEDFVFALKGSRYITHMLKLREATVPLANFFGSGCCAWARSWGHCCGSFHRRCVLTASALRPFSGCCRERIARLRR